MEKFGIHPIVTADLPDVARFLRRWRDDRDEEDNVRRAVAETPDATERRLRWLLEENPLASQVSHHGFCVRDESGVIRGIDISFPSAFVAGDERLVASCSGAFFVEPQARSLGLYLFKRYLGTPGYAFFFATTCNVNSGPVWKAVGARHVPNCDHEFIFPLNLDVMVPAILNGRVPPAVKSMASFMGRGASPMVKLLTKRPSQVAAEPCRDWEKLSALFDRHRSPEWLTTDRSAGFLEWRYGDRSPNHPTDVWLFRDERGNEGWFSLGHIVRGRNGQIRGRVLMDAVWPRDRLSFSDLFPAILNVASADADAIFFQPRVGVDYAGCSRWIIPRRMVPRIFAVPAKGRAPLTLSLFDFVPADGDSAFRISVWPESF